MISIGQMVHGKRRRLFAAVAFSVMALTVSADAQTTEPIKIGFLGTLTGPAAFLGMNGRYGVELAVKEINAKGGIAGRRVDLVVADDQGDTTAAVNEIRRLLFNEKVQLVTGLAFSQTSLAVLPVATEAKVLTLGMSGAAGMTPQAGPYNFSVLATGVSNALGTAAYFKNILKVKSAAVLWDGTPNAKDIAELFKTTMEKEGIPITGVQSFQFTETDMTPQLLSLRRGNPDAIYLITGNSTSIGKVLANRNELGWDVFIVGQSIVVTYPSAIKMAGPDAYKNTSGMYYKALTYCPGENVADLSFAKFMVNLTKELGEKIKEYSPGLIAQQYDEVYLFKAAVEGTGGKTDGPSVAKWIEENGSKIKLVSTAAEADKDSHFLMRVSGIVFVREPKAPEPNGLRPREGC